MSIAIWGDDVSTSDIKEGFSSGELLTWQVWDSETSQIASNISISYLLGDDIFYCNGLYALTSMIALSTIIQDIYLPAGWFMFSTYVSPEDVSMPSVVSDINTNLQIVKSYNGDVYWPLFNINSIGNMVPVAFKDMKLRTVVLV